MAAPVMNIRLDHSDTREIIRIVRNHTGLDAGESGLKCSVVSEGITNVLIAVHPSDLSHPFRANSSNDSLPIMVRIYGTGTELYLDREMEVAVIEGLERAGVSKVKLNFRFINGFSYTYVKGTPLTPSLAEARLPSIARAIARLHAVDFSGFLKYDSTESYLFLVFKKLLAILKDKEKQRRSEGPLSPFTHFFFSDEFAWLSEIIRGTGDTLVLCHNDLLCPNILFDCADGGVSLIDFEYSGPNYALYDVANFFAECYVGSPGEYGKLPSCDERREFFQTYSSEFSVVKGLQAQAQTHPNTGSGTNAGVRGGGGRLDCPKDDDMLNYFIMMSHLFWGLWGIVQNALSTIPYDYESYALARLKEYNGIKGSP